MPFDIKPISSRADKAIGQNKGYKVFNTFTNKEYSKKPLSLEKAKKQLLAINYNYNISNKRK